MDKLSQFVNEQIKNGADPTELKAHLAKNGWNERDVNTALANATGRSTRRKIAFIMVGIIVVAVLVYGLISIVNTTKSVPTTPDNNNVKGNPNINSNSQDMKTNTPSIQGCSDKDDSIDKDSCYKTLLKNGFDCKTLTDSIELTSCNRANEELVIKGVDNVEEN